MTFDIKEFLIENRVAVNEADSSTAFIAANISVTAASALRQTSQAQTFARRVSGAGGAGRRAERQKLISTIQQIAEFLHKIRRQADRLEKS